MLSIAMIHPLVMLVVVTTLYQKRGGHCFFIFKSGVIPENTRFVTKNDVVNLTLSPDLGRYIVESAFGDIYARDGLNLDERELVTVTSLLTAGGYEP